MRASGTLARGIIFVYDITRRDTFENLAEIWQREVDMYSTVRTPYNLNPVHP
jgi:GTPase SAR1 family protein